MLEVERLGGFAGFGGGRLRSRGKVALSALSAADRAAVEGFFTAGTAALAKQAPAGAADMFRYRLTRDGASVEVPEGLVPAAVRDCVRDTLE